MKRRQKEKGRYRTPSPTVRLRDAEPLNSTKGSYECHRRRLDCAAYLRMESHVRASEKYEVRHPTPSRGQRTKRSGAIRNSPLGLSGRRSFLISYMRTVTLLRASKC
jgi:hypothetical protein